MVGSDWRLIGEQLQARSVQWDLFTVLEVDWRDGLVRRSYSSDEANYPSGGVKELMESDWASQVIHGQQVFLASEALTFRSAFADFKLLESLGLHVALNVPWVQDGRTVRTLNLLRTGPAFLPNDAVIVRECYGGRTAHALGAFTAG